MLPLDNCVCLLALPCSGRGVLSFQLCAGIIAPCRVEFEVDARRQNACTYKKEPTKTKALKNKAFLKRNEGETCSSAGIKWRRGTMNISERPERCQPNALRERMPQVRESIPAPHTFFIRSDELRNPTFGRSSIEIATAIIIPNSCLSNVLRRYNSLVARNERYLSHGRVSTPQ